MGWQGHKEKTDLEDKESADVISAFFVNGCTWNYSGILEPWKNIVTHYFVFEYTSIESVEE